VCSGSTLRQFPSMSIILTRSPIAAGPPRADHSLSPTRTRPPWASTGSTTTTTCPSNRAARLTSLNQRNRPLAKIRRVGLWHSLLASNPASSLNQLSPRAGIPNDSNSSGHALARPSAIHAPVPAGEVIRSLWDIEGLNNYVPGVSAAGARTDPRRSAVPWWRHDAKWRILQSINGEPGERRDATRGQGGAADRRGGGDQG